MSSRAAVDLGGVFCCLARGNHPQEGGSEFGRGRMPYAERPGVGSRSVSGVPSPAGSAPGLRSSAPTPSAAVNAGGRESLCRRASGSDLKGRSR